MNKRLLVTTETQLSQCIEAIENSSIVVFDTETNGLDLHNGHHMVGIAFYCTFNSNSYYIPFAHGVGTFEGTTDTKANKTKVKNTNERYEALDLNFNQLEGWVIWDKLETVLTPDKTYLCHNAQFDLTALHYQGIDLTGATVFDSMLAARVLYSDFNRSWFKMPDTNRRERGNNSLKWQARLHSLEPQGFSKMA
jgi:DNA polymerase III epsilon subunit-like protein